MPSVKDKLTDIAQRTVVKHEPPTDDQTLNDLAVLAYVIQEDPAALGATLLMAYQLGEVAERARHAAEVAWLDSALRACLHYAAEAKELRPVAYLNLLEHIERTCRDVLSGRTLAPQPDDRAARLEALYRVACAWRDDKDRLATDRDWSLFDAIDALRNDETTDADSDVGMCAHGVPMDEHCRACGLSDEQAEADHQERARDAFDNPPWQ